MSAQPAASANLLDAIVAATRRIVEVRQAREPLAALARRAERQPPPVNRFADALARTDRLNLIAECKRRSPSRGVLRADYHAVGIARAYADAGAAAISVLTEPTFFDGSIEDLSGVASAVSVPVLRKDFIVAEYQLFEARAAGAAAVLLIVAALTRHQLETLGARAAGLGLDALVEVHTREELEIAAGCGARIIGVNNRNLRTLAVDVAASEELVAQMPGSVLAVSESGLKTPADVERLRALGYRAFLIGERFMLEPDPGAALRTFLDGSSGTRGRGSVKGVGAVPG
jgi:indole-3-glycerol phosphate synthase